MMLTTTMLRARRPTRWKLAAIGLVTLGSLQAGGSLSSSSQGKERSAARAATAMRLELLASREKIKPGDDLHVDVLFRNTGKSRWTMRRPLGREGLSVIFEVRSGSGDVLYQSPIVKREEAAGKRELIAVDPGEFWGRRFAIGSTGGPKLPKLDAGRYLVQAFYSIGGVNASYLTGSWESPTVKVTVGSTPESESPRRPK